MTWLCQPWQLHVLFNDILPLKKAGIKPLDCYSWVLSSPQIILLHSKFALTRIRKFSQWHIMQLTKPNWEPCSFILMSGFFLPMNHPWIINWGIGNNTGSGTDHEFDYGLLSGIKYLLGNEIINNKMYVLYVDSFSKMLFQFTYICMQIILEIALLHIL